MVRHLIVHAGFHKTGTTSIQSVLDTHRATLGPHIGLRRDMPALCEAARQYSRSRSAMDLALATYEAATLAEGWRAPVVLLSSEDLSGHMPGRHGLRSYDAAPRLARAMADTWRAALPDARIDWVFTTRAAAPWLASCHMQHLRKTRMRLDGAEYARAFARSGDLAAVVAATQANLPDVSVHALALDANPLGALLTLAGVPRDRHPALPHLNPGDGETLRAALLAINRADVSDADARAQRKAMLARSG